MLPDKMKLKVIRQTSKQYQLVKKLMHRSDIDELIIATDAGREGELVARWIIAQAKCHKPFKRLWISSQTDSAIKEGFRTLSQEAIITSCMMLLYAERGGLAGGLECRLFPANTMLSSTPVGANSNPGYGGTKEQEIQSSNPSLLDRKGGFR